MTRQERAEMASGIESRDSRQNGWKTICTGAVLRSFGITKYRYCQTLKDVMRILRSNGWQVRSRKSQAGSCSVGQLRAKIKAGKIDNGGILLVYIKGHVLLLDGRDGSTLVDTDPRQRDRREVRKVYSVATSHRSVAGC